MSKLIGSAGTLEQLKKSIQAYFFNPLISLEQVADGAWVVHNSNGPIEGCIVRLKGKRYRFEMLTVA